MATTGHISPRGARWPLLEQSRGLVVYLCTIVAAHWLGIACLAAITPFRGSDALTFAALLACGAVCIEATRRLGIPAGVSRDLLSAWWLSVAFLLPPVYALLVPIPLQILMQKRVKQTVLYRRVFSASAIGLAGGATSVAFHAVVADPVMLASGTAEPIAMAVACALLFALLNTPLVGIAVYLADRDTRWREALWDRESAGLDVVEICLGVIVAIACAVNCVLLVLTLPPVVLLQRSLMHAQLKAAARTDPKTGLLNAAAWHREADTEIVRARRTGAGLALLIIDIDHFKQVNDSHGHLVGDQVLAQVAATLRTQLREYDLIGRYGGEEFVVLLPHTEPAEARRVAERLRERVSRTAVPADDVMVRVTVSTGVAIAGTHGEDLIDLLTAADLALYRAKELGRDRVCLPAPRSPNPAETPSTRFSPTLPGT